MGELNEENFKKLIEDPLKQVFVKMGEALKERKTEMDARMTGYKIYNQKRQYPYNQDEFGQGENVFEFLKKQAKNTDIPTTGMFQANSMPQANSGNQMSFQGQQSRGFHSQNQCLQLGSDLFDQFLGRLEEVEKKQKINERILKSLVQSEALLYHRQLLMQLNKYIQKNQESKEVSDLLQSVEIKNLAEEQRKFEVFQSHIRKQDILEKQEYYTQSQFEKERNQEIQAYSNILTFLINHDKEWI